MTKQNQNLTEKHTVPALFIAIRNIIGFDIEGEDLDEMLQAVQRLTEDQIVLLLEHCKNVDTQELGRNQPARVSLVRFLVALFPRSQPLIQLWLSRFRRPEDYEIQFTLFCYLNEIRHFGSAADIAEVSRLSLHYLMNVKSDTGYASGMAGDMLANHWDIDQSLPVLISAVKNARFVSGRDTALLSLELLLKKDRSVNIKAAIREVLESIRKNETNAKIKLYAEHLLMSM